MQLDKVNKILAEACGITRRRCDSLWGYAWEYNGKVTLGEWTIKDPRCREVVRNWWLSNHKNASVAFFADNDVEYEWTNKFNESQMICKNSEEACHIAIAESLKDE